MADRMFYVNQSVRSLRHGMGIVVSGGVNPVVQFLDGPLARVMGRTIRIIPDQVYDSEVMNRTQIERWLHWRIHGVLRPIVRLLPRPRVNLQVAIKDASTGLPVPAQKNGANGVFWFTAEELHDHSDAHGHGILPIYPYPVRVAVRRMNSTENDPSDPRQWKSSGSQTGIPS